MIPRWWQFVIVFSAFTIQVVTFGIAGAIGLYNIEFIEYFQVSTAEVSIVGAVNLGVFLGAGPVASYMMRKIGYRQVAIIGSLCSTVGLLIMPFLNHISLLYIVYGGITGLGFALSYLPSSVLAGLYFNKHRSLASGIATSGSGLGQVIFPILVHSLIQHYGWKGSLFILAGLMLQCVVCSALLFPLQVKAIKRETIQVLSGEKADQKYENIKDNNLDIVENEEFGLLKEQQHKTNGNECDKMLNGQAVDSSTEKATPKHCYVLCDFSFLVFFLNNVFWNMGVAISWILAPEYFVSMGLSKANAAVIMTFGGTGCFLGCVVGGALGNIQRFSRLYMYIIWNLSVGVTIMFLTIKLFQNFITLSAIMFVNGIAFGGVLGLLVIFTVDLLGEKALGDGFGYLMLSNGVGSLIGPPIGGFLKDELGTYDPTFYFSGILILIGGFLMFLLPIRKHFTSKNHNDVIVEASINVD